MFWFIIMTIHSEQSRIEVAKTEDITMNPDGELLCHQCSKL